MPYICSKKKDSAIETTESRTYRINTRFLSKNIDNNKFTTHIFKRWQKNANI